ncbi:MAG: FAD-dependent monooxygenase [Sphingomonadaceae bacterium]
MAGGALIVGGGPAGSAAAIMLARAGMETQLFESNAAPGKGVCGGFLGWDALSILRNLGIDAMALGARPVTRLRLTSRNHSVEIPLPHAAASLSRQTLDRALLAAAIAAGARVICGRSARAADPAGRSVRFGDGETLSGDALFLATGKHELRGLARPLAGRCQATAIGLRASLPQDAERTCALAGMIELHLFDQGYAGLVLQEEGAANLCLSVARSRLAAAEDMPALMAGIFAEAPQLAQRVGADTPSRFNAIANVPYGWRAGATHTGVFRLGDQGAVIASLAGDGIAIALSSGVSAAEAMLAGGPDAALGWQQAWRRKCRRPLAIAGWLRHSAERHMLREGLLRLLQFTPQAGAWAARLTRIGT